MVELAKLLLLDSSLINKLENLTPFELSLVKLLVKMCKKEDFNILFFFGYKIRLAVILSLAIAVKEKYDDNGIDEKIYYDTMSDIKIWCEKNGNKGLKNFGWLKNHVSFSLFKLGRLQYQLAYNHYELTMKRSGLDINEGEGVVFVHIPSGSRLNIDDCIGSLKLSKLFIEKTFPDYDYRYYFCESWLLYEGNKEFMKSDSNIMLFSELFEHKYSYHTNKQAIEYIFGKRKAFKSLYEQNTSLQVSAKRHLLAGKHFGVGIGVIDKSNI